MSNETTRTKTNRASGKANTKPAEKPAEGNVETKTKDGRHRRVLASGAVAIV